MKNMQRDNVSFELVRSLDKTPHMEDEKINLCHDPEINPSSHNDSANKFP